MIAEPERRLRLLACMAAPIRSACVADARAPQGPDSCACVMTLQLQWSLCSWS